MHLEDYEVVTSAAVAELSKINKVADQPEIKN
jgi:hypothetical protein